MGRKKKTTVLETASEASEIMEESGIENPVDETETEVEETAEANTNEELSAETFAEEQEEAEPEPAESDESEVRPVIRHILVMDNGAEYEIVSQDGSYYYCGQTQFRRGNRHIREVMET